MNGFNPSYIVVHTAAYSGRNCDSDRIDQWHRDRGWQGIGYHFVIINNKHDDYDDGTVQMGRDISTPGAHTRGLNDQAIGICCVGHGDREPLTEAQHASLIELISHLIDEYDDINIDRVIGHREINELVAKGDIADRYLTHKTCPGLLVSMEEIRLEVRDYRVAIQTPRNVDNEVMPASAEIRDALAILDAAKRRFPNASEPLREFLSHPEVLEFREDD